MEQIDTGTVTTIHGFCSELLRSFPVEAGVDPGFVVDNGERTDPLLRAVWDAFVGNELGAAPPRRELWEELLARAGPSAQVALRELEVSPEAAGRHISTRPSMRFHKQKSSGIHSGVRGGSCQLSRRRSFLAACPAPLW